MSITKRKIENHVVYYELEFAGGERVWRRLWEVPSIDDVFRYEKSQRIKPAMTYLSDSESESSDEESEEWEVEEIIDSRQINDYETEYLVDWIGWPRDEATWEPSENLFMAKDKIEKFEEERPELETPKAKKTSSAKPKQKTRNTSKDGTWGRHGRFPLKEKCLIRKCEICGEGASKGRRYGKIVCEGCKCFFKRYSRVHFPYKCQYGENCSMDRIPGELLCRFCRFKKCIDIGMKSQSQQNTCPCATCLPNLKVCIAVPTVPTESLDEKGRSGEQMEKDLPLSSDEGHIPQVTTNQAKLDPE